MFNNDEIFKKPISVKDVITLLSDAKKMLIDSFDSPKEFNGWLTKDSHLNQQTIKKMEVFLENFKRNVSKDKFIMILHNKNITFTNMDAILSILNPFVRILIANYLETIKDVNIVWSLNKFASYYFEEDKNPKKDLFINFGKPLYN
ncbi:MAG: hypothetical protein LEGION0398_MBIBDBAK_00350 [Legionellaceae bacterium]